MKDQDLTKGTGNEETARDVLESRLVAWAHQTPKQMPLDMESRLKARFAGLPRRQRPDRGRSLRHTLTLFLVTSLLVGVLWRVVSRASYGTTYPANPAKSRTRTVLLKRVASPATSVPAPVDPCEQ